jgi:hypothetical protein
MTHPHLKLNTEKPSLDFKSMQFARLVEPEDDIGSDEELYAAVRKHGKAVIIPFNVICETGELTALTPEEFEKTWRGD